LARPRAAARPRHHPRRPDRCSHDSHATKDTAACSIRDDGPDPEINLCLDPTCIHQIGGAPLSKPIAALSTLVDQTVRSNRPRLGQRNWARRRHLRHPHHATNQGSRHLSADQEPAGCATIARSHKVGKYRTIYGDRGRRCARDGGTDRSLNIRAPPPPVSR
jgi:hypothetical protein